MLKDTRVIVNGKTEVNEKRIERSKQIREIEYIRKKRKQWLVASKPFKWVTNDGRYLSIHYDYEANHLTMKCQGVDAEKLPIAKQNDQIFRNKIVDIDTLEQRLVQFHAFFDNERHVISGIYNKRR